MSTDDHDDDDKRRDRGDSDEPTRDATGRWLPGHCPNPKGRPKKEPKEFRDPSDIRNFGSTMIDVRTNGQEETMDRRTALLHKMYESAMKGRVSMQRFFFREFERSDEGVAEVGIRYDRLRLKWVINNPDFLRPDYNIPFHAWLEIDRLRTLLNHYFPGAFPPDVLSRMYGSDDYGGDEGDEGDEGDDDDD